MPLSFSLSFRSSLLIAATGLASASPAFAETLQEALAAAYQSNPTLAAARAGQRANDENVPIQRAEGLPSVGVSADYSEQLIFTLPNQFSVPPPDRNLTAQGQLSIPIYSGGTVRNSIRAARTRVEAGQADLRGVEAMVFVDVVGAYMDVLRDEAVVSLNRNNVEVLGVNLQATQDRFDIGDLTRTDVAQSQARLALARSQLQSAEAQLIRSREAYIRLVGHAPDKLAAPPLLADLPGDADAAVEIALAESSDLESAEIAARAAGYDVRAASGARMPRVSLVTNGRYSNDLGSTSVLSRSRGSQTNATTGVSVTLPIFQGGGPAARVRQAQARESQALETLVGTERGVIAQTRSAYAAWRAAQSVTESTQIAVDANKLSLEGVRAENSVGTRSILDILNAEQELLNSQVQLVSARRDAYVAGFNLLASIGRAEAQDLKIVEPSARYDANANFERVRGRIWDWDRDPDPAAVSTRTNDSVAQTAAIPDETPMAPRP